MSFTLILVVKVGYYFFEVIFAEGGEDFLLIFTAYDYVAGLLFMYFISFSIELINRAFYYILFEY